MKAVVIQLNHISYAECGGKAMEIPCASAELDILGDYIGTPRTTGGVFSGYEISLRQAAPAGDQIPLVRIYDKTNGNSLHILGTAAQLRAACEAGDAEMPAVTVNLVAPIQSVCKNATTNNYIRSWGLPADVGTYTIAARFNTSYHTASGLADLAAVVANLNTNLAAAGTWAAVGGRLQLTSTVDNAKVGFAAKSV